MPNPKKPARAKPQTKPQVAAAHEVDAIRIVERRIQALQLRKTGMSYRDIGRSLGDVSHETIRGDVKASLEELAAEQRLASDELRQLELERLDEMQSKITVILYDKTTSPDMRLKAIDRGIALSNTRAKLLGLYAPVKVEVTEMTFTDFIRENGGMDGGDTNLLQDAD